MGTKQKGVPLIPSPRYFNPKIEDERKAAKNAKAILAAMSLTPLMKLFQERPRQGAICLLRFLAAAVAFAALAEG